MEKNQNFVQMYRDHMPELRWLMKKIKSNIRLFILLFYNKSVII